MWSLKYSTTPPAAEPLDLTTEVKEQLRLSGAEASAQATMLANYMAAARQFCQEFTGRQLITATFVLYLDSWREADIFRCEENGTERLRLPVAPLVSVASVQYLDADGNLQTWSTSQYDVFVPNGETAERGHIAPKAGYSWPTAASRAQAVVITFDAGYGAAHTAVPKMLKAGMLLDVERLNDGPEAPEAAAMQRSRDALYWPFRTW